MTYNADIPQSKAPILPENPPWPTNTYCPVLKRRMLWAPVYSELSKLGQCVSWDYYNAGRNDGVAEAYERGYLQGRNDEAEAMAEIQRQAVAIAHDVKPAYWVLSEIRGEPRRAKAARDRAIKLGYFI